MAEIKPKVNLLDNLLGKQPPITHETAAKCDMCMDLKGGPSCVNACPTGAAIRIHADQVVCLVNKRVSSLS
jgi:Fe-S-cluster-containing hydrogenase component 2